MQTIAIYCDSLELPGATFEKQEYWEAYSDLLLLLKSRGVKAYFVSDNASYLTHGIFTEGYTLNKKGSVDDLIRVPFIRADIVFNRGDFKGTDVPVINPPLVYKLGQDKVAMFEQLGEYQAFSVVCQTREALEQALRDMPTDLVVVKKPVSCGGRDVYIGTREAVLSQIPNTDYPLLAQEFMDTSVGVPGYVEGIHDLRIEMGGGEIWGCYFRIPKPGEYRANVAQGASTKYIRHDEVPAEVAALARRIDARFGSLPRFYALDFANTPEGWKLIELNSQPGLCPLAANPMTAYTLTKLADYLGKLTRTIRTPLHRKALSWPVTAMHLSYDYDPLFSVPIRVKRLADGQIVLRFNPIAAGPQIDMVLRSLEFLRSNLQNPRRKLFDS
jgi:glutathione synthase/RimK-type ligase-like ATP-grasp enzyme